MHKTFKSLLMIAALGVLGLSQAACGKTVQPGNVGVVTHKYVNAGVSTTPATVGWHFTGPGTRIIEFPTIQRTYTYTREPDARGSENEEVRFSDHNALPMTADVQLVMRVNPADAPRLYTKYRLSFDELFEGPIRNDVLTAISKETELVTVEDLYTGGRQQVIQKALGRIQHKWAADGVNISQLDWIGSIRYPDVILHAIQAKTEADAKAVTAQATVAVAKANAEAAIATAYGKAESTRLEAQALAANPAILRQKEIEKWKGLCPLDTKTCILGNQALAAVE